MTISFFFFCQVFSDSFSCLVHYSEHWRDMEIHSSRILGYWIVTVIVDCAEVRQVDIDKLEAAQCESSRSSKRSGRFLCNQIHVIKLCSQQIVREKCLANMYAGSHHFSWCSLDSAWAGGYKFLGHTIPFQVWKTQQVSTCFNFLFLGFMT